jgi:hypothetical protein
MRSRRGSTETIRSIALPLVRVVAPLAIRNENDA